MNVTNRHNYATEDSKTFGDNNVLNFCDFEAPMKMSSLKVIHE